eukprot:scpid79511/ scgid14578/ Ankyrin repeat domain-containing protein 42
MASLSASGRRPLQSSSTSGNRQSLTRTLDKPLGLQQRNLEQQKPRQQKQENLGGTLEESALQAILSGDVALLESSVKRGLSVSAVFQGRDKFTALHLAALHGSVECLQWLLWQKVDTSLRCQHQWTALHVATIRGQDACAQTLLSHGARHDCKDDRGSTPCHLAAVHGHNQLLQTLLRSGAAVDATDILGWSPLHSAAYHGRLGAMTTLVRWGGDLKATDGSGNLPGHHAASQGHLPCLKFIMSAVSDVQHQLTSINDQAETMKDLAGSFLKQSCLDYLDNVEWDTQHGGQQDTNLAYPGHAAAYQGNVELLHSLLARHQISINDRDERGATLVHRAAGNGQVQCLKYLIDHGADVTLLNAAGESGKDIAQRYAHLACVALLGGDANDEADAMSPAVYHEEARERSRLKVHELQRLLELAKVDFEQVGGDRMDVEDDADEKKAANNKIQELQESLEYERVRREQLESDLDAARAEISYLKQGSLNRLAVGAATQQKQQV